MIRAKSWKSTVSTVPFFLGHPVYEIEIDWNKTEYFTTSLMFLGRFQVEMNERIDNMHEHCIIGADQ